MKYVEEGKFETKYNQEQWDLIVSDGYLYFYNKNTLKKSCPIAVSSNEVIEQVSDYEFFMVSNQSVEKELCVVNLSGLEDDELDVHYQRFEHCYSLSDDFLLFKDPNKTIKYDVYSIKSRGNLKGFSWLSTGYDISAIDLSGDGNRNIVLYVEKKIGITTRK